MSKYICLVTIGFLFYHVNISAQAVLVSDINPDGGDIANTSLYVLLDGRIAFSGKTTQSGIEPWSSDGTAAGTKMIAEIKPGAEGEVLGFFELNNKIGFVTREPTLGRTMYINEQSGPNLIYSQLNANLIYSQSLVLQNKLYFAQLTGLPSQGTRMFDVYTTNGTQAGTLKVAQLCSGCKGGEYIAPLNASQVLASDGNVLGLFNSSGLVRKDSLSTSGNSVGLGVVVIQNGKALLQSSNAANLKKYFHLYDPIAGISSAIDSIPVDTLDFQNRYYDEPQGILYRAIGNMLYVIDVATAKVVKQHYFSSGRGIWHFTKCNGKLYFYTQPNDNLAKVALIAFDPVLNTFQEIERRVYELSINSIEPLLCVDNHLTGEWSIGQFDSGVAYFADNLNPTYFSNGTTSFSFVRSGNHLFWIGEGPGNTYPSSLWKLDLATVALHEPLPHQLDVSVYPTLTTQGEFNLGGTDSQVQLMSAQLVNSAGRIVHITTRPTVGEPLQFGYKAPGLYYVYLIDMQGRKTITKVVYH
jgi:ELWxxDGT repeat protein